MSKKRTLERGGSMKGKKQKQRASHLVPSKVDRPISQAAMPVAPATPTAPKSAIAGTIAAKARLASRPKGPGLVTDYRYVISDLRRIALVAGTMFVILIVLSFILR